MGGYRYRTKIPRMVLKKNLESMIGPKPGQIPMSRRMRKNVLSTPARPKRGLITQRLMGKDVTRKEFLSKMEPFMPPRRTAQIVPKHRQPSPLIQQKMLRGRRPFKFKRSTAKAMRNPRIMRKLFRI